MKVDRSEARKVFFFEKKQKTFESAVADLSGERATAESKVFWSFFFKKGLLAFYEKASTPVGLRLQNVKLKDGRRQQQPIVDVCLPEQSATAETKAFWFFFSKKNCFLTLPA